MGLRPLGGSLATRDPSSPKGNCDWQDSPRATGAKPGKLGPSGPSS